MRARSTALRALLVFFIQIMLKIVIFILFATVLTVFYRRLRYLISIDMTPALLYTMPTIS